MAIGKEKAMKSIPLTLLFAFAAYYGWTHRSGNGGVATADLSATQIQTLAASVKAKDWLTQNGFAFTKSAT